MAELEKVLLGLECCSQSDNYSRKPCKECSYNNEWKDGQGIVHLCQITQLRKDALFLLKAHKPRVMTLDEAVEHAKLPQFEWSEKAPVYIEYHIKRPSYVKWLTAESLNLWLNDDWKDNYNRAGAFGWRCWTSRPTDEQREAVKWNAVD